MRNDDESSGDATQVFEDLRAEVSVLHRSVERLPEEWEANQPPDYTESLGQITQGLSWTTLAAEINLAEANHDVLSTCRETATKTKKEQRCSIVVPAP